MFGFILGTLCLVALIATVRGRRYAGFGHGGRCGGPFDYEGPWREGFARRRHRMHPRDLLRELFVRLDTTPGQEKAIVAILERARERARELRGGLKQTRAQLGALVASDVLDRAALQAVFATPRELFTRLESELEETLAAVHEVLDDRQRRILGELIADGSLSHAPGFRW